MRKLFFAIMVCCIGWTSMLQAQSERCGTMELYEDALEGSAAFEHMQDLRKMVKEYANVDAEARFGDDIIRIPLHVVIVHLPSESIGQGRNLSEERILSQIKVLNDDFRRLNADRVDTPDEFLGVAADTRIEFCLAAFDEDGNPTTGITRYASSTPSYSLSTARSQLLPNVIWDPSKYMNLVSCRLGSDLLGFAAFPGSPASYDCVTIGDTYFGYNASDPIYNLGRTATHEVGHYLGLFHIWGNCNDDDDIDDTPLQKNETGGCPNHPRPSCGSNDMFQNYMDYSYDACMNIFTVGQMNVMRGVLNGYRKGITENIRTKCSDLSPAFVVTNYPGNEVCRGLGVDFESQSGAGAFSYQWTFEGGIPATSMEESPTNVVFYQGGNHTVTLTVTDEEGESNESVETVLNVLDGFTQDNLNDGIFILTESDNGGYVSGHNNYSDKVKAEFFQAESGSELENIKMRFAIARGPESSQVKVNIWDADGGSEKPNTILATVNVDLADIDTTDFTTVNFDDEIILNGPFYAGIELDYTNGTEIALYTNEDGDTDPATAWERFDDGTWKRFDQSGSWNLKVALGITATIACEEAVASVPVALFSTDATEFCAGEIVKFNNESLHNPTSYDWDFGDGTSSIDESPEHVFATTGDFIVSLTATNEEGSHTQTKTIAVNAKPAVPEITLDGNTLLSSVTDATDYKWYLNGTEINNENGNQIEVANNGSYTLEVFNGDGCSTISAPFDYTISGIFNGAANVKLFSLYPNPANKEVEVKLTSYQTKSFNWELVDLTGKTVLSDQTTKNRFKIDISHLNNGIYFIKIEDENKQTGIQRLMIN